MGVSPVWDKQGFCEGEVGIRVIAGLKCSEEQMLLEATIGPPALLPVSTGRSSQARALGPGATAVREIQSLGPGACEPRGGASGKG